MKISGKFILKVAGTLTVISLVVAALLGLVNNITADKIAAIDAEKKAAISELQGSVADLSISIASRVIGSDLNDEEHRKIVERYVNEAGSFNAN